MIEKGRRFDLQDFPKTNWKTLAKIRRPSREKLHFAYLTRAFRNSLSYKHTVASMLGRVEYSDIIPQVAEMLLSLKRISWCLCTGRYKDQILFSVRTSRVKGRAGKIARQVAGSGGTAGGHDMIAGGQVDCMGKSEAERDQMERKIVETFFRLMGKQEGGELSELIPPEECEKKVVEEGQT